MNNLLNHVKYHQRHKKSLLHFFVFLIFLFPVSVFTQENKLLVDKNSIDIILMLDKSESLDIENGSTQNALQAAKYLVDFIYVYQQKSDFNIRLAFITFGETVDGALPLQKLSSDSKKKILEGIKTGKTKKTNFVPAFHEARELLANSKESQCFIFLFSDGIPDLRDLQNVRNLREKEYPPQSVLLDYFNTSRIKNVIRFLTTRMNVDIEVIGFNDRLYGRNRTEEGNPNFIKKQWDRLLEGSPGSFHSTGTGKLDQTKVVHEILEKSLYGEYLGWSKLGKEDFVIDLEPFLEWAVFTIIKENQDDRIVLEKSKGEPLKSDIVGKDGHYLIYYLKPPIKEKLIVKHISGEDVWYKINKRYPEVRFELEKKAKNRRYKGLPLLIASEGKLELSCFILGGDGIVVDKNINLKYDGKFMKYDGNGKYIHKIELSPDFEEPIVLKPKIETFYNNKIISLRKDITEFTVESQKFVKKSDDYLILVIGSIGLIFFIAFLTLLFISKRREKRKTDMKIEIKEFNIESENLAYSEIVKKGSSLLEKLKTEFIISEREYFKSFEDDIYKMFYTILKAGKKHNEVLTLDDFLPIFDRIKNSSSTLINCLAKVLCKEKWNKADFDEIIFGIYKIIDIFENPGRILFHITESSNHGAVEIIKSMTEIYDIRDEELQENLRHYLSQIRKAYQNFQDKEELGVKGYAFFDGLLKLLDNIENSPYPEKIDYLDNSTLEIECWKNSIELLCDLNYLDKLDYEEAIRKIRVSIEKCNEIVKGPESKIILSLLKKWYFELSSVSLEPVEIELSFAPELAIKEEMIKDPSLSLFSIFIKNNSRGYAYDVHIVVNSSQKEVIDRDKIGKVPKHSNRITKIFKIYDIEKTIITASYKYLKKKSEGKIVFVTKTKDLYPDLGYIVEKGVSNEVNPFSLEPYASGNIFVNRENDIATIESAIMNKSSQILAVFGMRRVGKTSLINFLMQRFSEKYSNIKCIGIPSSIFNRKHPWENEEFLGVLTRRIFRESSICDYVKMLSSKWHYQDIDKMELNSFWEFMDDLMIVMNNQKLVIFFDDADYFEKKIKGSKSELFPGLKDLLEFFNKIAESSGQNKGDFNIIFLGCNNVLGDNWKKTLLSKPFFLNEKISNLKLFEKDDVSKIVHLGNYKLPFNNLSLEYLMRITGGHPALTQYICILLRNERDLNNKKYSTVPLSLLHKITKQFVNDIECRNYCWYISRFSLPEEERMIFYELLKKVDTKSLELKISDAFRENINCLIKYQFIDSDSYSLGSRSLRIGIFKLFPDNSFLVQKSIEGMFE